MRFCLVPYESRAPKTGGALFVKKLIGMASVWIFTNPAAGLRIRVGTLDADLLNDLGVPTRAVPIP